MTEGPHVERGARAYVRARRDHWSDLADFYTVNARGPRWLRRAAGHFQVAAASGVGAASRNTLTVNTPDGMATIRQTRRRGTAIVATVGVVLAMAAAALLAPLLAYLAGVAAIAVVVLSLSLIQPAAGPGEQLAGRKQQWQGGVWTDAMIHVRPERRGRGHGATLAQTLLAAVPDTDPVHIAAHSQDLKAVYQRWWPHLHQTGDHHLSGLAGASPDRDGLHFPAGPTPAVSVEHEPRPAGRTPETNRRRLR